MKPPDFNRIIEFLQSELSFVQMTFKDKGWQRFLRPLLITGILIGVSYQFVYAPPVAKLAGLDKKLVMARATSQYADRYKDLRGRLNAVYAVLPSQGGQGLAAVVVDSLKAQGIMADALQPPTEVELAGMMFQSVSVTMTVTFSELASWILRIEASKPLLHISKVEVRKKDMPIGSLEATCLVMVVLPKVRY